MRASQILGIIVALALIVFGLAYPVPEKYVSVSSSSSAYDSSWEENRGAEYIGGDCYNYQIEASLKAGYLTGVLAMKAITFVGGLLLFFLTQYSRLKCLEIEEQTQSLVGSNERAQKDIKKLIADLNEHFSLHDAEKE